MSRRRWRGGRSTAASKAGPTDADVFAGTIADQTVKQLSDPEQYWMLFKKHPWIRACVRIIGNAVTQEGFEFVPIDGDDKLSETDQNVLDMHDFLRVAFIGKCNTFRKFRKAIIIDQQTYGCGYARKKYGVEDGEKTLVAIERLNARRIQPHLSADKTEIDYYILKPAVSDSGNSPIAQVAAQLTPIDTRNAQQIPADEMLVFSIDEGGDDILPSPSPLEALDLTCAMDLNIRQHRNSFFSNGTSMGMVIYSKTANEDQVRDAQKKMRLQGTGPRNAYRNIAIGGDWGIMNLMQSGRHEVDFVKGSELTIEEVCAVYSIPPAKLRDVSGSMGQAGKGEDDETFEQECVLPIEENFYETLTIELRQKKFADSAGDVVERIPTTCPAWPLLPGGAPLV